LIIGLSAVSSGLFGDINDPISYIGLAIIISSAISALVFEGSVAV
jgi:hypothetical protein